ncbi:MAG: tetratricopeptide repeat protein, partial [Myxococcota bacterium]
VEAEQSLARLTELDPRMARAWSLRARVAAARNDVDRARSFFSRARSLDPELAARVLERDVRLAAAVR